MWNRMKMWYKSELYHNRIDGGGNGDGVNATIYSTEFIIVCVHAVQRTMYIVVLYVYKVFSIIMHTTHTIRINGIYPRKTSIVHELTDWLNRNERRGREPWGKETMVGEVIIVEWMSLLVAVAMSERTQKEWESI